MSNFKITIAYDGTDFEGFQAQTRSGSRTVQGELNRVVNQLAKNPDPAIKVIGASRTDAGVHAHGQVANFNFPYVITEEQLLMGMNSILPRDIQIKQVEMVSDDFHARHDTKQKRYYYRVSTSRFIDPFKRHYTTHFRWSLDVDRIREALPDFLGEHDFVTFSSSGNQTQTTIRTVTRAEVIEDPAAEEIRFIFEGNAFLYNQIRIMVGVLLEIGTGKRPVDAIPALIAAKDRELARYTAAASGLYLDEIDYN